MEKTAKRRKVWVTFDGDEPVWVEASAKKADLQRLANEEKAVRFTESRPGDVVLSRAQRQTIAVVVKWMDDAKDGRFKVIVEPDLRALLRGGR